MIRLAPVALALLIACSDQMAVASLAAIRDRGLDVPNDVSLVSFDDTPIVRFTHPPLTAVVQPIADTIARAVEMIIDEQAGRVSDERVVVMPTGLVERSSTAAPRRIHHRLDRIVRGAAHGVSGIRSGRIPGRAPDPPSS